MNNINLQVLKQRYSHIEYIKFIDKEELLQVLKIFPLEKHKHYSVNNDSDRCEYIYITVDNEYIIVTDNRNGDAWTEEFLDILHLCEHIDKLIGNNDNSKLLNDWRDDATNFIHSTGNLIIVLVWVVIIMSIIGVIFIM
jgi:hypothetical protein